MRGSMKERRPGVWRLRVFTGNDPVTGAKRYASRTFSGTQRQAENALSAFVTETTEGAHGSPSTMTFAGMLDAYCEHVASRGRSVTTIDSYRRHVDNIRDGIGRKPLSNLRPADLDELYSVLSSRGVPGGKGALSPASVRRHHAFFRAALNQAVRWGWLKSNPADRATPPTMPHQKVTAPTPAELQELVARAAAVQPWHGLLVALAAITGGRRGELAALRWSDVDLDAGVVHIRRALKQVGADVFEGDTKTHQERTIALPPAAVELLRRFRVEVDDLAANVDLPLVADPFVFSPDVDRGRPYVPSSLTYMFARIARAAGMPYHLHSLRHFAATQAIAAGFDPVAVAARLGHADPSVTLRVYAHAIEGRDRALAETLGGIVSPAEITKGDD